MPGFHVPSYKGARWICHICGGEESLKNKARHLRTHQLNLTPKLTVKDGQPILWVPFKAIEDHQLNSSVAASDHYDGYGEMDILAQACLEAGILPYDAIGFKQPAEQADFQAETFIHGSSIHQFQQTDNISCEDINEMSYDYLIDDVDNFDTCINDLAAIVLTTMETTISLRCDAVDAYNTLLDVDEAIMLCFPHIDTDSELYTNVKNSVLIST